MTTFGMWGGCCSGNFGDYGSLGWFGPILNLIIIAGVIIGLVWLLVWTVRRLSSSSNHFPRQRPTRQLSSPAPSIHLAKHRPHPFPRIQT